MDRNLPTESAFGRTLRRLSPAISPVRWSGFGPVWAWTVTVVLCLMHGAAIWIAMGGWDGLSSPWPLYRHDHPFHFHGAVTARHFFRLSATNAGYDPSFMAGYAMSSI